MTLTIVKLNFSTDTMVFIFISVYRRDTVSRVRKENDALFIEHNYK